MGNVKQYEIFIEALRRSSPVPLAFEAMELNTDGYFSKKDQRIALRSGMITDIDRNFVEIVKKRGIDLTESEQIAPSRS